MATLPLEQGRKRPVRQEALTLEKVVPQSHYISTQLAVRHKPLKVSELSVWIDLLPQQEIYIGLEFQCKFLPLLISPHVTIGKFVFANRVKISKLYDNMVWTLNQWDHVKSITLSPYGSGFNWEIEAATDFYWLCRQLRKMAEQAGLEGLWLPSFHVSWHCL